MPFCKHFAYYGVMIEINKNNKKIFITPFCEKTLTIDFLQFLDKILTKQPFEIKTIFNKNYKGIFIVCFYLLVDNGRECNAICFQNKKVSIFGESFIKKDMDIVFNKKKFKIFVGKDFCRNCNFVQNAIFLCDFMRDKNDQNVYNFNDKTRIFVYKNEDNFIM